MQILSRTPSSEISARFRSRSFILANHLSCLSQCYILQALRCPFIYGIDMFKGMERTVL